MRFLFVMDPMDRILPDKDTTFAFQRAALSRGHVSLHAEPGDIFIKDGDVFALASVVEVSDTAPHVKMSPKTEVRLAEIEGVFIRKDPPFDAAYLYLTQMLERARGRTVIMNDPRGLRDANEKLYALHFPQFMPRTLVTSNQDRIHAYVRSIGGKGVIKPLDGAGGSGVLMLTDGDKNARSIVDMLTNEGKTLAMVQEFLPAVVKGDKRVLLLDGEILGAINRVPRADDLRSNIHVGGSVEACDVTTEERALVASIAPRLRSDGLIFVGLDLIGGKLTEVNVTSPTGIQELSRHVGREVSDDVIAWVERRAEDFRPRIMSQAP